MVDDFAFSYDFADRRHRWMGDDFTFKPYNSLNGMTMGSQISYTVPTDYPCETYTLREVTATWHIKVDMK